MYIHKLPLVQQRLPVYEDYSDDVLSYGAYNVYPQSMENYMQASGVCSSAVQKFRDFCFGDGLANEELSKLIVNRKQDDLNDLLEAVAFQHAFLDTICLHIGYNGLYQVDAVSVVPVSFARLSNPNGEHEGKIAIWNNWANESWNSQSTKSDIKYLHTFNPDPSVVAEQIKEAGGISEYHGQILYLNKQNTYTYSRATFDSVLDDVISDAAFATYRKKNVKSSFSASGALFYNSYTEDEREREEVQREVMNLQGDANAGNVLVITPEAGQRFDEGSKPIEFVPFQPNNIDGLYEKQEKSVSSRIIGIYNQPRALHTFFDDSGIYNQDLLQNAWLYYNEQTKKDRKYLSRVLKMVFDYWKDPIESDYKIKPQSFGEVETAEVGVVQEKESIDPLIWSELTSKEKRRYIETNTNYPISVQPETESENISTSRFAEFGVGGVQGILAIQNAVSSGITAYNSGLETLKIIYGFEDVVAREILGQDKSAPVDTVESIEGEEANVESPSTSESNESLKNLSGRQIQGLQRIIRKYNKGELTKSQALIMLKAFELTDDQAETFLTPEEDGELDN